MAVQFHADFIDVDSQISYTEVLNVEGDQTALDYKQLPRLRTPLNSAALVKQRSLLMILWGRTTETSEFTILAQSTIRLDQLKHPATPLIVNNQQAGSVQVELCFIPA